MLYGYHVTLLRHAGDLKLSQTFMSFRVARARPRGAATTGTEARELQRGAPGTRDAQQGCGGAPGRASDGSQEAEESFARDEIEDPSAHEARTIDAAPSTAA